MRYILTSYFLALLFSLNAQQNTFSKDFLNLADQIGLELYSPTENTDYKAGRVHQNNYQSYDFVMRSRKEKLEIRYKIIPYNIGNPLTVNPHVQVMRTVASVASNDDEGVLAYHDISSTDLEKYGADWGQIIFCNPKEGFADEVNCKLIVLYKEGQGTVLYFLLFDNPTNEAVDLRSFDLKFVDLEEKTNE